MSFFALAFRTINTLKMHQSFCCFYGGLRVTTTKAVATQQNALIFYRFSLSAQQQSTKALSSLSSAAINLLKKGRINNKMSDNNKNGGEWSASCSSANNGPISQQQNGFFHTSNNASRSSSTNFDRYQMANPVDLSPSERAKRFAAYACGDAEIRSGMNLGIGSGSTIKYLIDWLYEKTSKGELAHIQCVPTSHQTREWLHRARLPVYSLDELNDLDLCIDGADEVDAQLTCIKGGGGCLLREKIVQTCAKRFILIGNLEKYSDVLGASYDCCAVEVVKSAYVPMKRWIEKKVGGQCVLRMDKKGCFPTITENSNYILDWHFPKPVLPGMDWHQINQILQTIPGVVETGFFVEVADLGYFATPEGLVKKVQPKKIERLPVEQQGKMAPEYVTEQVTYTEGDYLK